MKTKQKANGKLKSSAPEDWNKEEDKQNEKGKSTKKK